MDDLDKVGGKGANLGELLSKGFPVPAGPIIPVPFRDSEGNRSILIQAFGDFVLDGTVGGYGTFETLRRASRH